MARTGVCETGKHGRCSGGLFGYTCNCWCHTEIDAGPHKGQTVGGLISRLQKAVSTALYYNDGIGLPVPPDERRDWYELAGIDRATLLPSDSQHSALSTQHSAQQDGGGVSDG